MLHSSRLHELGSWLILYFIVVCVRSKVTHSTSYTVMRFYSKLFFFSIFTNLVQYSHLFTNTEYFKFIKLYLTTTSQTNYHDITDHITDDVRIAKHDVITKLKYQQKFTNSIRDKNCHFGTTMSSWIMKYWPFLLETGSYWVCDQSLSAVLQDFYIVTSFPFRGTG